MLCILSSDDADAETVEADDATGADTGEACDADDEDDDANSTEVGSGGSEANDENDEVSDEVDAADAICSDSGDSTGGGFTASDPARFDTRVMARCKATPTSSSERASANSIDSVVGAVDFRTAAEPAPQ